MNEAEDTVEEWKARALSAITRADDAQRALCEAIAVAEQACYPVPSHWRKAASV